MLLRELFKSPRMFQVWEYTVGHKQLLLRSTKEEMSDRRIDVYFKNVGAINLLTVLNGLEINEATAGDAIELQQEIAEAALDGRRAFFVGTGSFQGYVVASMVAWHEDGGEYDDPSYFKLRNT